MRTTAVIATLAALAASGCAPTGPSDAERARQALIGMSLADLESCIGHGATRTLADGRVVYTYDLGAPPARGGLSIQGGSAGNVAVGGSVRLSTGGGGFHATDYCRAVIVLRDGKVEKIDYSGEPYRGYPDDVACSEIVSACLPRQ